ncbi:PrgI family protein [Patescibacteria group bacterium]|nr:PrgI family protein [Patescibacteria group bacterium]
MRKFTVPQFIDIEDKILGPLTVRQFLIMLVCFMVLFIYYKVFDFTLFVVAGLPTFGVFGVLAFTKVNGRPFHYFILNLIQTAKKPGLRVWSNADIDNLSEIEEFVKEELDYIPISATPVSSSRLTELSLVVDTTGTYKGKA